MWNCWESFEYFKLFQKVYNARGCSKLFMVWNLYFFSLKVKCWSCLHGLSIGSRISSLFGWQVIKNCLRNQKNFGWGVKELVGEVKIIWLGGQNLLSGGQKGLLGGNKSGWKGSTKLVKTLVGMWKMLVCRLKKMSGSQQIVSQVVHFFCPKAYPATASTFWFWQTFVPFIIYTIGEIALCHVNWLLYCNIWYIYLEREIGFANQMYKKKKKNIFEYVEKNLMHIYLKRDLVLHFM